MKTIIAAVLLLASATATIAHPGGLDPNRCHEEKATGTRHCH